MTRVAVTGSSGKLGRAVVDHLTTTAGTWSPSTGPRPARATCVSIAVDLTDFGQTFEALAGIDDRHDGVDAVVHLAAIPAPGLRPNAATFHNNMTATYNVFSAALRAGVRNIVWASSETVLGLPFDEPPPYVPVDEDYPPRPNSTYSLVKTLEEELARQLCRWHPDLKMIGLRFSQRDVSRGLRAASRPSTPTRTRGKWNLWGYIDARDGAQAVRLALEYGATGDGRVHHRQRRHGDVPAQRATARRGVPRRTGDAAVRPERDAPVHRQGTPAPRLRTATLLAGVTPDPQTHRMCRSTGRIRPLRSRRPVG